MNLDRTHSSRTNRRRSLTRSAAAAVALSLTAIACGSGGSPTQDAAPVGEMATAEVERGGQLGGQPPAGDAPEVAPGSGRPGAISRWEDVTSGVVRIETVGSYVSFDRSSGDFVVRTGGTGSGFFIDSDGTLVTNNHVVNGAASLEVYVPGETAPRNARVLGVSECWDLAVIDVDGEDFPFFDWATESPTPPQEVYAVGHAEGAPQVAVTEGVVSRVGFAGEYPFASVDAAIEHTAQTAGGSSGGPLVTSDGYVVAVHNAGSAETQFGIAAHDAEVVIDQLRVGNDVDVIGITADALPPQLGGGVLVEAVQTGSPAYIAGLQPGDIILDLENVPVALDGTLSQYCDILRSHAPDAALKVTYQSGDAIFEATLPRAS